MPYKTIGFRRFPDPESYPATAPPWGTLSAIDMNTGKYLWKIPFGEYPELVSQRSGTTPDRITMAVRWSPKAACCSSVPAFSTRNSTLTTATGKLLWETELPFAGLATPATYMVNGKQYVVIAAGGGQSSRKPSGGVYVAFALP